MADNNSTLSTAAMVAAALDDDGTVFETEDGRTLADLCDAAGGEIVRDGEAWIYDFKDGSAISGNANGWDLGREFGTEGPLARAGETFQNSVRTESLSGSEIGLIR